VSDALELNDETVRVTTDGTISLPLAGTLTVAGLSEEEIGTVVRARIGKYIKDPEVKIFVKQYYSRQVGVIGMVQKPGIYTLQNRSETILEVLSRAGGVTENASRQILFIPSFATDSKGKTLQQLLVNSVPRVGVNSDAAAESDKRYGKPLSREEPDEVLPAKLDAHHTEQDEPEAAPILQGSNSISIDIAEVPLFDAPLRPGDVIVVPAVGEVVVEGWVPNPGAFKIIPGMTAVAAIGAAGGPLFSSSAQILRSGLKGRKQKIAIDLSKVRSGDEADVQVQSGDVVYVNRSVVGSVPYGLYQLFNKFATGAYVPLPF